MSSQSRRIQVTQECFTTGKPRASWQISATGLRGRVLHVFRKTCGAVLASILIATGLVWRARQRAHRQGTITAIYFHNPSQALFTQCVTWLTSNGYEFISVDQLSSFLSGRCTLPTGAVWLSIDDGFRDILRNVIPLVRVRKIPITLFVPTGIVQGSGLFPWVRVASSPGAPNERHALTLIELKTLAADQLITLGSHTVTHTVTAGLGSQIVSELADSKQTLETWSQTPIRAFAYPEGRFDFNEEQCLRSLGYSIAATTQAEFITNEANPYYIPRFGVGDDISLSEAICNMTGVWRRIVEPLARSYYIFGQAILHRTSVIVGRIRRAAV